MKNKLKIILTTVIFTIIMCASVVYAENETTENTTNTTNTVENTTTNTTDGENKTNTNTNTNQNSTTNESDKQDKNETSTNTTIKEEKKKSSNANLKNLGIKPNDFKGFKPGTSSYKVKVPNDVKKVEVYATAENSESIVTGTGNRELKVGENELIITVTAEDGTTKTYTIYVTRLEEVFENEVEEIEEKKEEIEVIENKYEEGNGLSSIKFENATIEPEFKTNIYEYKVKYIGELTQLNIQAEPTDSSYIVQITGNENLQEGENIITILVSDKDDNNVATYQITVDKKLVDEEAIAREKEQLKKVFIIAGIVAIVIVVIIIVIIKIRKNKTEVEEYTNPCLGTSFSEDYKELDDSVREEKSKEDIKNEYLETYNNYEDETKKRKVKSKGKRFK